MSLSRECQRLHETLAIGPSEKMFITGSPNLIKLGQPLQPGQVQEAAKSEHKMPSSQAHLGFLSCSLS